MKLHTTIRKWPDSRVEIVEVSLCRLDDEDFVIEQPDGSVLIRVSGQFIKEDE